MLTLLIGVTLKASMQSEMPADTISVDEYLAGIERAANAGDTEAMNYLGYLLLSGEEGVERDAAAGLTWLVKAAQAGDIKAASNIGWLYLEGDIIEKDESEGARWIARAAEAGLPVARSILGDLYKEGRGVARDSIKADSLYREAFEGGFGDAGYKLYELHSEEYVLMDASEQTEEGLRYYLGGAPSAGVKLFYMAADRDDPRATALLGDAYTRAVGVPYDHDLSLKYYLKAALAGHPSAQFVIGELLDIFPDALRKFEGDEFPDAIEENPLYWYEKAAEQGVTDADIATKRLFGWD